MSKKNNKYFIVIIILLLIVILALFFLYKPSIFVEGATYNLPGAEQAQVPLIITTPYQGYWVTLEVTPPELCVGKLATGTITSNIPNGICALIINVNDTGFQFLANINLNAEGKYTYTHQMNAVGKAVFKAICCDSSLINCRYSNEDTINVRNCWWCCKAMGLTSCYLNGCPPAGELISGPYDTLPECQSVCSGVNPPEEEPEEGIVCEAIWNPSISNCATGLCNTGVCTYVPPISSMPARCECQTHEEEGICEITTPQCANACIQQYGSSVLVQCAIGGCNFGYVQVPDTTCSQYPPCDTCCCLPSSVCPPSPELPEGDSRIAMNDAECDACCELKGWAYGYFAQGEMMNCWRDGNCCCYSTPQEY